MRGSKLRQRIALAARASRFLRHPLDGAAARVALAARVDRRGERFVEATRRILAVRPDGVHARLLRHAGCALADLEAGVRLRGLEPTLEALRAAGVYVSGDELKCRVPIVRPGLEIQASPADFDNPRLDGAPFAGATSGSSGVSTRVLMDWALLTEEAANECVLLEEHGLFEAPGAFWMPAMPSISGIHNLLVHLKFGRPPARWFSQLPSGVGGSIAMTGLAATARLAGLRVPWPRHATPEAAPQVAAWLVAARRRSGRAYLKAFASAAVRVAEAARESGFDLAGCVFLTGGEPLTATRHRILESTGARAFARYVSTESGFVGAGCPRATPPDGMHLYTDRLAVIQPPGEDTLLFTAVSDTVGKILLNTDLGDRGVLSDEPCDCGFGRLGMRARLSEVRSQQKLTGEGMTLMAADLVRIVEALVLRAGGGPDDFQFREHAAADGMARLIVVVDPAVPGIDAGTFVPAVLAALDRDGEPIVAEFWRQAGTLQLVRERPVMSAGGKLPRFVRAGAP